MLHEIYNRNLIEEYKFCHEKTIRMENNIWTTASIFAIGSIVGIATLSKDNGLNPHLSVVVGLLAIGAFLTWGRVSRRWWSIQGVMLRRMKEIERLLGFNINLYVDSIDETFKKQCLFSWDDIKENDNGKLIKFLKQKYDIDWVKTANIEKIDNCKTIKVSTQKNYLSLKLNDEKKEVNLEIDDGRTDKFVVNIENRKQNIYNKKEKILEKIKNLLNISYVEHEYHSIRSMVSFFIFVNILAWVVFIIFKIIPCDPTLPDLINKYTHSITLKSIVIIIIIIIYCGLFISCLIKNYDKN